MLKRTSAALVAEPLSLLVRCPCGEMLTEVPDAPRLSGSPQLPRRLSTSLDSCHDPPPIFFRCGVNTISFKSTLTRASHIIYSGPMQNENLGSQRERRSQFPLPSGLLRVPENELVFLSCFYRDCSSRILCH